MKKQETCRCRAYLFPHRHLGGECGRDSDYEDVPIGWRRWRPEPDGGGLSDAWQSSQDRYEAALDARASQ